MGVCVIKVYPARCSLHFVWMLLLKLLLSLSSQLLSLPLARLVMLLAVAHSVVHVR